MKTVLVIAAALGLSTGAALAECAGHAKINASADVDRQLITASILPDKTPVTEKVAAGKTDRLTEEHEAAE